MPLPTPTQIITTTGNDASFNNNNVQTTNDELPRWRQALRDFSNRANNICFVITYPFMVVLTVVGLFVVVAFCIFPTLLLAIMVVCIYYCLTEDPIPLSVLLRYLLSVDEDEHGHPDHYTMAQNRPVVQKKLIIRKVLEVLDKTSNTEENEEPPRGHPFPITIVTEKKVLKYSEPLIFKDEESNTNENGEVAPPPVSHAFLPAPPPVDEEAGIQLTPQQSASPQSPTLEEDEEAEESEDQNDDHSDAKRKEESVGESKLELPSGSSDDEDEVYSTNSIHDHHKTDSLEKMEDKAENDGKNSDDETDDSVLHAAETLSLEDAPVSIGGKDDNDDDGDGDDQDEEDPPVPIDAPPITDEIEPAVQEAEEEEEVREVFHDDYFGINEQQDRGTTCDICLLEFEPDDLVAWSPNTECSHCFHKDCILDWLVRKHSCPSCRKDYLKGAKDDDVPAPPVAPNWPRHRPPPPPTNSNNTITSSANNNNNNNGTSGSSSLSGITH